MKAKALFFLIIIFSLSIFSPFQASANIQEEIRAYLRLQAQTKTQETIAGLLGVSQSRVSAFIKKGSSADSPKIVHNFQEKYPQIYRLFPSAVQQVSLHPTILPKSSSQSLVPVPSLQTASVITLFSSLSSQTPFVVVDPNNGPLGVQSNLLTNSFVQRGVQAFQSLNPFFLPQLSLQYRYSKRSNGCVVIEELGELGTPFGVRVFGPDFQGRFGWVARGTRPLECFALALKSEESRESLPVKYPVGCGYDGSHMLDCAHTAYPSARFTSNRDANNLFPQNPDNNRCLRKPMTQQMGATSYRELYLYNQTPTALVQKRRLDFHKKGDRLASEDVVIPSGTIFISFSNSEGRVYFLPENTSGNTASLYNTLYEHAKTRSPKATYATAVIPQFHVQNAVHFFCPYIYDTSQLLSRREMDFYRTLYMGINIDPSSFGDILSLVRDMGIYFHWASPRDRNSSPLLSMWNYFRLPTQADSGELKWDDTGEGLIPTFSGVFNNRSQDIVRFRRYVSESLIEQVIKSPLSTIKMKLGVVQKYLQEERFEKAIALMQLAYLQIEKEGTIENALSLLRLYGDFFSRTMTSKQFQERTPVKALFAFVEKRKAKASVETLVDIKRFNEDMKGKFSPIEDNLEKVKSFTKANSTLLAKGILLNDEIYECRRILESLPEIEECSLQDIVFTTDNYWTTVMELDEDDSIQDVVTHEEYFWTYARPFYNVMKTLEERGTSLKRLSLRNLSFGLYTREDGKVSCSFDASNILKTLRLMQLPSLEELHITGFIESSDNDAITILENLPRHFPKLQRLYYAVDKQTEHEIHRDDLPKLTKILRGKKDDEPTK